MCDNAVSIDVVVLTVREAQLSVLVRPHRRQWALPGDWLGSHESLDVAARRQLETGTGLLDLPSGAHLEQLRTYRSTYRATSRATGGADPVPAICVAYLSLLPGSPEPGRRQPGDPSPDGPLFRWVPVACLTPSSTGGRDQLAFDHGPILLDGVERARAKLEYSSLATAFCAEPFTLADLRRVYEAVWGVRLDVPNFRRKVLRTPGLVEPLGRRAAPASGGRPAELYRRGAATILHPAMLRA